ncbi:TetR/AcrR family transcriptional regulator [Mycobacteroides immunogenum]|uniref:TetR family transcriptional regulator n=1 Tax=Mycobacteroides immunogenum TaxID=83262 RepID=A0A7V8LNU9_9MYCO|nr:TetR/AcrR family transcriptional regulator [Mycobacteroides immunogenum]AMT73954.1 TetR family transcriptional regulator [Mycobacteroides immunogenum]ANO07137.1 TetR family transcriptional regulator [Mycobacteroides immunogenum]KIU37831.1 TetR family transcriptional regulator [Mycobacteroides immunogenum]KPG07270.1 TetR family transcriptional regulator [Mycobacteroides immunogenum]KPG07508.1 TetR family transcriptional regulator [Mycobacteroides immunogenum]
MVSPARSGTQTRGDRQRDAIMTAVAELIAENHSFADLSVSAISERAGVGRSGFYFYFDSKYSVLAQMVGDALAELEELTHYFASRGEAETPEQFAQRMVGSAALVFAHNDPLMKACMEARITDPTIAGMLDDLSDGIIEKIVSIAEIEVKERGAQPLSDDLPALVRSLVALTASTLSGDTSFVGRDSDSARAIAIVETLWRVCLLGQ